MTLHEQRHHMIAEMFAMLHTDNAIDREFLTVLIWVAAPLMITIITMMVLAAWYPNCFYGITVLNVALLVEFILIEPVSNRARRTGLYNRIAARLFLLIDAVDLSSDEALAFLLKGAAITEEERELVTNTLAKYPSWLRKRIYRRADASRLKQLATSQI